ncbi:divalent-cation tolerance protein CutA [soil metagenome]|jgi:periplasmic divalent cation tolerance protein
MANAVLLALSTFPDVETATRVSEELVGARLVACANIIGAPVRSLYHWRGNLETSEETMVFFKTTADCFAAFQAKLEELHPYEVPEIISFEATDGLPAYLSWVHESTTRPAPNEP